MSEPTGTPAETHQLVWLRSGGGRNRQDTFDVHAIPAGLSQRARRARVGKLLVEHGAERRRIQHGIRDTGCVDISTGDCRGGARIIAHVLPAGTAQATIEHRLFPGISPFQVSVKKFSIDGDSGRWGDATAEVIDPVPAPYHDPEDPHPTWDRSDMLRWLSWLGLKPLEPVPTRLGQPFAVQTQVASLQLRGGK